MAKVRRDPKAKRNDETHLQWRARLAKMQETDRKLGEGIVTPETLAQGGLEEIVAPEGVNRDKTYRRRSTSSLQRLNLRGVITDDQLASAQEIAMVAERIEDDVRVSTSNLSARVDCGGSGKDPHHESLHRIRMERAYSSWRLKLPLPRRMVIDMVEQDHQLAKIASAHGRSWKKAVIILKEALDMWFEEKQIAFDRIDQDDVDRSIAKVA